MMYATRGIGWRKRSAKKAAAHRLCGAAKARLASPRKAYLELHSEQGPILE